MATPVIGKWEPPVRQSSAATAVIPRIAWTDQVSVSAVAASYTVPANVTIIRLFVTSAGQQAYGNLNGSAVVPAAGKTDGTGSFPILNGMLMSVKPGDVLSIIGAGASFATIDCFT